MDLSFLMSPIVGKPQSFVEKCTKNTIQQFDVGQDAVLEIAARKYLQQENVLPANEPDGLYLLFYNNQTNKDNWYPLSKKLIDDVSKRGWTIVKRIGQGSQASVFLVQGHGKQGAMVLLANIEATDDNIHQLDLTGKMEFAKRFPDVFPLIYDYFSTSDPYSDDPDYAAFSPAFEHRTIQILELVVPLNKHLEILPKTSKERIFQHLVPYIKNKTINDFNILRENGVAYSDLKIENMGFVARNGKLELVFIDLQGLSFRTTTAEEILDDVGRFIHYQVLQNDEDSDDETDEETDDEHQEARENRQLNCLFIFETK